MGALEELVKVSEDINNPYLNDHMAKGGKVIGYFCTYIPEEIICAAGAVPFRIRATGSTQSTLGDSYLSYYNCSFTRHCLDMALRGKFDFLEGMVAQPSCDHVRRIYDVWEAKVNTPFIHFVKTPRKNVDGAPEWYKKEIVKLKEHLEKHLQVKITDEKLRKAIKVCNETRSLVKSLYALRKGESPPITGADSLAVVIASTAMPKDKFNELCKKLLAELGKGNGHNQYKARLMVISPILDNPGYIKVMEDAGGLVVCDYLCFGTRAMWDLVDETIADPIEAITKRYMERNSCPRMMGDWPRRLNFIKGLVKDFKVDAIVCSRLTFCELWAGENYMIRENMKVEGVPTLVLEREEKLESLGQLKTRIQALIEMIED